MQAINTRTDGESLIVGFNESKYLAGPRIEQAAEELHQVIPQSINKQIVLSFAGVSFLSSAIITKLIMFNKACKEQGVSLRCREISTNVMEVFRISKLDRVLNIVDEDDERFASK